MYPSIKSMIRLIVLCAICLLTTKLSFSQTGYPKLILYKGDTVIALTQAQVKAVNLMKVDRDRYKDLLTNMKQQSTKQDTIILNRGQLIDNLTTQKEAYVKIASNNEFLAKSLQRELDAANKENRKLQLKSKWFGYAIILETIAIAVLAILK